MTARALMFQGTGSDVGKSLIVAGLCRVFARRGLAVRPFKPQNMSNNAAVTADGGEIGRAQALQARACGVPPTVDMNPVLLKPQSEIGAQVVVQGRVIGAAKAREYQALKPKLLDAVLASFSRLKAEADLVIVEGAGSAAEINLARRRHRQHGLRPRRPLPGRPCRRHRPRRRVRPGSGNCGRARGRRSRDHRGLHRQQVPRRREPVRRRHADSGRVHRLARLRPRRRSSPRPPACRPKTPSGFRRRKRQTTRRSRSPCRRSAGSPISTTSIP